MQCDGQWRLFPASSASSPLCDAGPALLLAVLVSGPELHGSEALLESVSSWKASRVCGPRASAGDAGGILPRIVFLVTWSAVLGFPPSC